MILFIGKSKSLPDQLKKLERELAWDSRRADYPDYLTVEPLHDGMSLNRIRDICAGEDK